MRKKAWEERKRRREPEKRINRHEEQPADRNEHFMNMDEVARIMGEEEIILLEEVESCLEEACCSSSPAAVVEEKKEGSYWLPAFLRFF